MERTVDIVAERWRHAVRSDSEADAYIDATALNLHAFYTGIEHVFEDIATTMDESVPSGDAWHSNLVRQMAMPIEGVRPAVIGNALADRIDDYRRFRHLIRNVYATQLEAERMESLVSALPSLWRDVRLSIEAFSEFLNGLLEDEP